jgi:hypothetical protein
MRCKRGRRTSLWDEETESIPYDGITSARFGDRYTTVLARYVHPLED